MMIEQNTNYAFKLTYMANPTFDKVRDLAVKFYRELPQELQDELYEALNRGVDILDSEPQMTAYLFSFGKMHQAKLEYAFGKLSDVFLSQDEINIIDYGCGQAVGTMSYADYLREKGYSQKVKTITLIEPSEICLNRAALHASIFFPDAEIKTVNKKFDGLTQDDIICSEETPTLHILSNVLDMTSFDLGKFSELIKDCLKGFNQFVCVGPTFYDTKRGRRMSRFASVLKGENLYKEYMDSYEFDSEKNWTCSLSVFTNKKSLNGLKDYRISNGITSKTENNWANIESEENFRSCVSKDEIKHGYKDKYGVVYDKNGRKLLKWDWKRFFRLDISYGRIEVEPLLLDVCTIQEGTIIICDNAFEFSRFHQIIIPDSVIVIGKRAFSYCTELQKIVIPNSVAIIGKYAFNRCRSLQQVIIPESVTNIEAEAFSYCSSLQQIIIQNSNVCIEKNAFGWCSSLQRIIINRGSYNRFKAMLNKRLRDKLVEE